MELGGINIPLRVLEDRRLNPNSKLIYGLISANCDVSGLCRCCNKEFGRILGLSAKSVSKCIDILRSNDWINVKIDKSLGNIRELKIFDNDKNVSSYTRNRVEVYPDNSIPMEEIKIGYGSKCLYHGNNMTIGMNKLSIGYEQEVSEVNKKEVDSMGHESGLGRGLAALGSVDVNKENNGLREAFGKSVCESDLVNKEKEAKRKLLVSNRLINKNNTKENEGNDFSTNPPLSPLLSIRNSVCQEENDKVKQNFSNSERNLNSISEIDRSNNKIKIIDDIDTHTDRSNGQYKEFKLSNDKSHSKKEKSLISNDTGTSEGGRKETMKSLIDRFTDDPRLRGALNDFVSMRKSIKRPLTKNSLKRIWVQLQRLSDNTLTRAKIVEQSVDNCWKGVFELNNKGWLEKNKQKNYRSNSMFGDLKFCGE